MVDEPSLISCKASVDANVVVESIEIITAPIVDEVLSIFIISC